MPPLAVLLAPVADRSAGRAAATLLVAALVRGPPFRPLLNGQISSSQSCAVIDTRTSNRPFPFLAGFIDFDPLVDPYLTGAAGQVHGRGGGGGAALRARGAARRPPAGELTTI